MRVGTQGLFRQYLKTFVPPFLPTRLTAPGSLTMAAKQQNKKEGKKRRKKEGKKRRKKEGKKLNEFILGVFVTVVKAITVFFVVNEMY